MKIICNQLDLVDAMLKVQKAVATKSTLAALEGILLKTKNNNEIELCGYNLELGIKTLINAKVEKPGAIVLNAKLFLEIAKKLPDKTITISVDNNLITTIHSGESEFSIIGLNAEDYPEVPKFEESLTIQISCLTLKSMIKQTIFAVSELDSKPVHTGTLFDLSDGMLTLVSVDGFRFALRKEFIEENKTTQFVVPGKTLSEILRLIPDDDEIIQISIGVRHIIFKVAGCQIFSRLLEGQFLDYKAAIPSVFSTKARVNVNSLTESIDRVSLLIADKLKSPVCCLVSNDEFNLSCVTTMGKAQDKLKAVIEGEKLEIGFNSKYLLDSLKNTDTDQVKIEFNGSLGPIKITPIDGESFIFLVLPVRLRSN